MFSLGCLLYELFARELRCAAVASQRFDDSEDAMRAYALKVRCSAACSCLVLVEGCMVEDRSAPSPCVGAAAELLPRHADCAPLHARRGAQASAPRRGLHAKAPMSWKGDGYSGRLMTRCPWAATQVAGGYRPSMPKSFPEPLARLIASCWAQRPADRPACAEVQRQLELMRDTCALEGMDARSRGGLFACFGHRPPPPRLHAAAPRSAELHPGGGAPAAV